MHKTNVFTQAYITATTDKSDETDLHSALAISSSNMRNTESFTIVVPLVVSLPFTTFVCVENDTLFGHTATASVSLSTTVSCPPPCSQPLNCSRRQYSSLTQLFRPTSASQGSKLSTCISPAMRRMRTKSLDRPTAVYGRWLPWILPFNTTCAPMETIVCWTLGGESM